MKVVILTGRPGPGAGRDDEADTRVQADLVRQALKARGITVGAAVLGPDLDAARADLARRAPDLVFNLVEAVDGRGDWIHLGPALLDAMGLIYTGCPQAAVFLTSNKLAAKRLLALGGIPTPRSWARGDAGGAWIVKSAWEHASLGIDEGSVVRGARVPAVIAERTARFGGEWFAERFVAGREFNLSLLEGPAGPEVLPPAEIRFDDFPPGRPRIVDYAAKWDATSFAYHHTPRRFDFDPADGGLLGSLKVLALQCWGLFDLRGYARVDVRVDDRGRPWVLEVNTNPCLSPDAGFMAAAGRAGLDPAAVIRRIVTAANASPGAKRNKARAKGRAKRGGAPLERDAECS